MGRLITRERVGQFFEGLPLKPVVVFFCFSVLFASPSYAQSFTAGAQFFCMIAQYFKYIVGTCALVAIVMWAIEHIFGVARLHDMVIKVGIACAIVAGGATLVAASGLTTNCVLT